MGKSNLSCIWGALYFGSIGPALYFKVPFNGRNTVLSYKHLFRANFKCGTVKNHWWDLPFHSAENSSRTELSRECLPNVEGNGDAKSSGDGITVLFLSSFLTCCVVSAICSWECEWSSRLRASRSPKIGWDGCCFAKKDSFASIFSNFRFSGQSRSRL